LLSIQFDDCLPRKSHEVGISKNHYADRVNLRERKNLIHRLVRFFGDARTNGNLAVGRKRDSALVHDGYFSGHASTWPARLGEQFQRALSLIMMRLAPCLL
jgi:hypothetical protein